MQNVNHQSTASENFQPLNRRQFLQWSGLMSMGYWLHFDQRSHRPSPQNRNPLPPTIGTTSHYQFPPLLQPRSLTQPAITLDQFGVVIHSRRITVTIFEETLGPEAKLNSAKLIMVRLPGGQARLGSVQTETGRFDHEEQPYDIAMPTFFMGMTAITQQVYAAVMGCNPTVHCGDRRFIHPEKPVVGVTWENAIAFCHTLTQRTGRTYRLPTEAEWEYACRAGTQSPFHCGMTITGAIANYNSEVAYDIGPKETSQNTLTPVGQFPPNAFGLFDMHGNVWEWCTQQRPQQYQNTPILRGGAWNSYPWVCRSAVRLRPGTTKPTTFGLRVVCSVYV